MNYPKELLKDIYWSFAHGPINSADDFAAEIKQYYKDLYQSPGQPFPYDLNETVFEHPKMEIVYMKYVEDDEDEDDEPSVVLTAENNLNFSRKELLFQIHDTAGRDLEEDDNCYFEGLQYSGDVNEENVPIYFMITGS